MSAPRIAGPTDGAKDTDMSDKPATARLELLVYAVLLCIAIAVFWSTLDLPTSTREPLGSASIPQIVSVIIGIFCVILILRALRAQREAAAALGPESVTAPSAYRRRTDKALICFGLALVFAFALDQRLVNAAILTPAFLLAMMLVLKGLSLRSIFPCIVIALIVGISTTYVFKHFFYIDLP